MPRSKQRFGHKPVSEFIEFVLWGESASGITKIWAVQNTLTDEYIGKVRWHGAWRKYVYDSPPESFYDWECLRLIADFIEQQTQRHKAERAK